MVAYLVSKVEGRIHSTLAAVTVAKVQSFERWKRYKSADIRLKQNELLPN